MIMKNISIRDFETDRLLIKKTTMKEQFALWNILRDEIVNRYYFPFITEEIYQELYHDNKSIHLTEIKPLQFDFENEIKNGDLIIEIISSARGEKTNNNVSLKTPIKNLIIELNEELKEAIELSIKDFKATLFIEELELKKCKDKYEIKNIELNLEEQ